MHFVYYLTQFENSFLLVNICCNLTSTYVLLAVVEMHRMTNEPLHALNITQYFTNTHYQTKFTPQHGSWQDMDAKQMRHQVCQMRSPGTLHYIW